MGLVLVLMVFLYPLGMPLVTPASYIALLILTRGRPATMFALGLPLTGFLVLALGPSIVRTGAGSFALPWWLQQSGTTEYYVWHYALVCMALLLLSVVAVSIYRLFVPLAASPEPRPESTRSSQNTEAILAAVQSFRAGKPVSQVCATCGSPITVESVKVTAGQGACLQIGCRCKQCNGRFPL